MNWNIRSFIHPSVSPRHCLIFKINVRSQLHFIISRSQTWAQVLQLPLVLQKFLFHITSYFLSFLLFIPHNTGNLPSNTNLAVRSIVSQFIPRSQTHIKMILITTLTGILHCNNNYINLASNAVITTRTVVSSLDLAATIPSRRVLSYLVDADCYSHWGVWAAFSAGTNGAVEVGVYGCNAGVAREERLGVWRRGDGGRRDLTWRASQRGAWIPTRGLVFGGHL